MPLLIVLGILVVAGWAASTGSGVYVAQPPQLDDDNDQPVDTCDGYDVQLTTVPMQTGVVWSTFWNNYSAYGVGMVSSDTLGVALPVHFADANGNKLYGTILNVGVRLYNTDTGAWLVAPIVDVGPHNTNDPYWSTDSLPKATTQPNNHAGIDLTPLSASTLGFHLDGNDGLGTLNWEFVYLTTED